MQTFIDTTEASTELPLPAGEVHAAINVEELFRKHQQHLFRFVQRYVRNSEDAEDVVQNTFFEAVRCADRFSGLSKPSTWLFGIALNLARNQVRRKFADLSDTVEESVLEQIADTRGDPAKLVEHRQLAYLAQEMMEAMPVAIRETFEAVMDGDCTYEEAAALLDIPVGTVRSRVSRARSAIRARLA